MLAFSRILFSRFIDGTVADTDIHTDNWDDNRNHDHSYYGNGCPNDWGKDGDGGSTVSCSTRMTTTYDGETQKNGTYYNFQASASGSGGTSLNTDNANASDTFCPLGWQLPYGGTGGDYYDKSKSFSYIKQSYSLGTAEADANKARSYPLSYILGGSFHWGSALLYRLGLYGLFWSSTAYDGNSGYWFGNFRNGIESMGGSKSGGYALRCINCLSSLHRRHGGKCVHA